MSYGFTERFRTVGNTSWVVLAVAVLLVAAPFLLGGYQTGILTQTIIVALFATAFNLLYGYTGLLSFGHAMFVAAAGYTVATTVGQISPALGVPEAFGAASPLATWTLALVLGVLVATLLAVFVGFLSVRLEEIYFALITLAFSMAVYVMVLQDTVGAILAVFGIGDGNFTNGSDGLTFIMGDVDLFGWQFQLVDIVNPFAYYFLALLVVSLGMYALWRIVNSPFGMVCRAIRENPERASALGIDVNRHQWMTFIISGAFSGLAGALLIPLATNVNPSYAYWTFSAEPVIMTVIGGPYAFFGPIVGAFTYEYLRWFISQFPLLEEYWQFSFGVLLLLVVLFFDNGVAGGVNRFRGWLGVAAERYRAEGIAGVLAFGRETVVSYALWIRSAVVASGRQVLAGIRSIPGRVTDRF
jgi:branched-chain amino acid transport system permease protein